MKLWMLPPSANCHGCMAVISHLKLDIEMENAFGKTRTAEYLAMNPCHSAPCLELDDDGGAIWESNAILRYLAVNFEGGEKLYPSKDDPAMRGKIDMVMDWRQTSLYPLIPNIGYIIFGKKMDDDKAKADFAQLLTEVFPVLVNVYLKDTKFIYGDEPTIADLSVAPCLTFLKARSKFWEKVPEAVKEYQARVFDAFPDTKENFDILDKMCTGCDGEGADLEP